MLLARYRMGLFILSTLEVKDIVVITSQVSAWEFGTIEMAGHLGERTFGGTYRYSHFWRRDVIGWQVAGSQMTPLLRSAPDSQVAQ